MKITVACKSCGEILDVEITGGKSLGPAASITWVCESSMDCLIRTKIRKEREQDNVYISTPRDKWKELPK